MRVTACLFIPFHYGIVYANFVWVELRLFFNYQRAIALIFAVHLRHIETYLETKYERFLFLCRTAIFWKNTKAIVHGFVKNGVLR